MFYVIVITVVGLTTVSKSLPKKYETEQECRNAIPRIAKEQRYAPVPNVAVIFTCGKDQ